jgi:hypothetical protein
MRCSLPRDCRQRLLDTFRACRTGGVCITKQLKIMLTERELDDANAYGEFLRVAIHEKEMPASARVRASGGCLLIAQDHHHAILVLFGAKLYASAFALIRIAFEAYVRGEWLSVCATEEQVEKFMDGKEPPKIGVLLEALEKTPAFQEQVLSRIKKQSWDAMCAYTHTGGLHVQRWITADGIEPNYSREEVLEVLKFADIIVSLSVLGALTLAGDDQTAQVVFNHYKARMGE